MTAERWAASERADRWAAGLFMVLLCFAAACPMEPPKVPSPDRAVATALASGANAALPLLVAQYKQDGLEVIQAAHDRTQAEMALAAVDQAWEPRWKAWKTLAIADEALAKKIEAGGDTAAEVEAMRDAFCALRKVWPKTIPAQPLTLVVCKE